MLKYDPGSAAQGGSAAATGKVKGLFELARKSSARGRPRSLLAYFVKSVWEDLPRGQFFRTTVAGSVLLPRALRWILYRLSGLRIDTPKIREECVMANSHLAVGYGTSINRACYFEGSGSIAIGSRCAIGPECAFITSVHERDTEGCLKSSTSRPIAIGDRVWLGARVTVLPGAVIEEGCTVAAGSVVSGRCTADSLYGGVPARPIVIRDGPNPEGGGHVSRGRAPATDD